MSIATKLQNIIDAKADIASAITAKSGTVPTKFADYGDAIRDLPSGGSPVICGVAVTPSTSAQTITATSGVDGYSPINVSAVTSSIDQNISAGNIKSGVEILGVTGTYEGSGGGGDAKFAALVDRSISGVTAEDLSGATKIGGYAFYKCSGLTSVTIPSGVTVIGDDAFMYCTGLMSVTIPNSVTSIGDNAFRYCSALPSVTIPNSVTSIVQYAFADCSGLTSVTIGSGVTSIGASTFRNCSACTLFDFRSAQQVPSLSNVNAFQSTNANKKIVVPDALYDSWVAANNWKSTTNGIVDAITRASDYNP